jgi:cobalt/nickel transport system permease protein
MTQPSPEPTGGDPDAAPKGRLARYWWVAGLAIAGVVAALAAAFASRDPDGLNAIAIEQGFEEAGKDPGFQVLPGYTIPGLEGTSSTVVAAFVGIALVLLLVFLLGRLLARRRKDRAI